MTNVEKWLPTIGFPGYEISDHGRVRNSAGAVLSQLRIGGTRERRYPGYTLYRDGKPYQRTVHVLMLEAFVELRPKGMQACHRDDDPDNNSLDNLYWGTPKQNARDKIRNGGCWKSNITHCPQGHEYSEENTYRIPSTGHRLCRTCIKAKNKGNANKDRTHCPQGHPYDEENTIHAKGRRQCRECGRARAREYQRRKRGAV